MSEQIRDGGTVARYGELRWVTRLLVTTCVLSIVAGIGYAAYLVSRSPITDSPSPESSPDAQALRRLVDAVEGMQGAGKPIPSSTGYRFFLALFIGDGTGGAYVLDPEDDAALPPEQASLLISRWEYEALTAEMLEARIRAAREAGLGVKDLADEIDNRWCSWAGPRDPQAVFGDPSRADEFVVANGMRYGESLYPDGFIAASRNEVRFFTFEELAEDDRAAYDPDGVAVHYGRWPLANVLPYDE